MAKNDTLRQQAEAWARENAKAVQSPENLEARMRPEEVRHALHELRVHQIELEMQNEELRRTQLELVAARARYFDLYDLAPVGYVTVSEQGLILEANLTAATLLGVARGALTSQPIFSRFILKEDQDLYYLYRKQLFQTGTPQAFELRMVKQDGTARVAWAHLEATTAQDAAGATVLRVVLSDITERKQAEAALRASEEKYRVVFNNEIYAICIFDLETLKLLDANEAYAHLYGYSREELVSGMTVHDITAEHQASDAATTQAAREGTTYIPLRYHRKKDGTIFPVEIVGGPYVWQGRKVMFALAHDITARQRADEELRLFKAVIAGSEEALAISDSGGKLIYINPAHQRLFGRTLEQARQTHYRDYYPPESIEILDQVVAPALARGESWTGELDVFDAAGRRFPLWERAGGLTDADGTLLYGFGFMHDITERKLIEDALRESEERLASIYNTTGDIIFLLDVGQDGEYRFNTVNPAFFSTTGLPAESVVGRNVKDVIPEPSLALVLDRYRQAIQEKTIVRWEETSDYPTGRLTALVTIAPILDADGTCRHLVGNVHDITDRKQAEEALRESEEQFRALFMNSTSATAIIEPDTTISLVNDAYCLLSGYTREEVVGTSWTRQIPPEDLDRLKEYNRRRLLDPKSAPQKYEFCFYTKTGEIRHALISVALVSSLGKIIASFTDITERKQAEDALRVSEQKLRTLFDLLPVGVSILDSDRRVVEINAALERILDLSWAGLQAGQYLQRRYLRHDGQPMPAADFPSRRAVVEGRPVHDVEIGVVKEDDTLIWTHVSAAPLSGGQTVVTTTDITDRKRAESQREAAHAALRELNVELQTRNEELDAFAHTVAHDLKNLLGVMMNYAEMLAEDYSALPTDLAQKALVAISRSGRKAANIIDSLFLLASVRQQDVQVEPLDMARLVAEVLLRLADSIQASGADINVPDPASWPVALGYAPWIEEIWINYLSNALKYGGPCPRIDLDAALLPPLSATARERGQGGGFIRFSVRDDGPGLTPEQQERLFVPFERLGQTQIEGHGLGLSIVRRIADKLGGQAGVDSAPGTHRGSTFYFTLPAAPDR